VRGWTGSLAANGLAETWTTLMETAEGARPNPILSSEVGKERTAIAPPNRTGVAGEQAQFPRELVDHNFDDQVDFQVWSGVKGIIMHHLHDQGGAIEAGPVKFDWQGFKLDFSEIATQCPLIAGATYLVTLRLKILRNGTAPGTKSDCEISGSNCPRIRRKILRTVGGDRFDERL